MSIKCNEFKKGRGLWKFNNSLLYDEKYLDCIRNTILEVKKQYAIHVYMYNFDNIHNVADICQKEERKGGTGVKRKKSNI
jgi:hypothetical protein